jgi:hypothetical protein
MTQLENASDDHFINLTLNTQMALPENRDTLLHFFGQVKKKYPTMSNFYGRDSSDHVLEEDKEASSYRWVSTDKHRVFSGYVNPETSEDAIALHRFVLEMIPYSLSVNELDCESMNLTYGFDFTFRGNQNQLLADALGFHPAFDKLGESPNITLLRNEPSLEFSFGEECSVQCRLSIETRTNAYHVRTGNYPDDQLSVYLTARHTGSLPAGETYQSLLSQLDQACASLIDDHLIENVLQPLQQTIAIR